MLLRKGVLSILFGLLSTAIVVAQSAACPELVTSALAAIDDNCSNTGRNEACYGYDQVEARFLVDVADDYFSSPASISPIAEIESIRTAPLNTETGVWGVALMNLQANLPNTLPGQNVTFILLGDVEVENAVAPDDSFQGSEGIDITVDSPAGANVRSGAGTNFNVISGVGNGEVLVADGFSEDGQWLRVVFRNRPAWISRTVIDETNPALSDLPTLSSELRTPMQAFYLRTGIGQTACEEAPPDGLMVQGPENIEIELSVNGANIRLGSSGMFRVVEVDGAFFLDIMVFDGEFEVGGVTIRRGQHSLLCLGDEGSRGLDGEDNDLVVTCDPSPPARMDMGEWCTMEELPSDILNYGLDVPCPDDTPPPSNNTGQNNSGGSDSQVTGVNCANFSILTTGIAATDFTLSWTEATGADSYEVAGIDSGGIQVFSATTSSTSLATNGGAFPPSGYIDVRAYQGGVYACYARLDYTRAVDPNEANYAGSGGGSGVFDVSASCFYDSVGGGMKSVVTWSNLGAGATLNGSLVTMTFGSTSNNSTQTSGSMVLFRSAVNPDPTTVTITTTDGDSYNTSC